jgi:acetyltransferase-like isoleucine patch superfamily enzyme
MYKLLGVLNVLFKLLLRKIENIFWTIESKRLKSLGILEIGAESYGEPRILYWDTSTKLKIGSFVSIAPNVTFILGGNHYYKWLSSYPLLKNNFKNTLIKTKNLNAFTKGDIIVGNDVWIGYGATILSGVKIGDGAVIAACTVVTKNVPAYAICVGNPGKIKKYRFDSQTIQELLQLEWWKWKSSTVKKNVNLLNSPLTKNTIKRLRSIQPL